ncbi:uncharacterized protein LOC141796122 isoform X2 [Halichoeres trimaculatus]|uniref:uncharacterized protein LOC141796122 isoform X2 n=1 Tax=Halichoeres trimaculatus TaxID=147232 RepID=UPI003D9EC897
MAHFLLDSTDPQEALLLEDHEIPLKECEKLDQRLALALQHLSLLPHGRNPGAPPHSETETPRETYGDTGNHVSTLPDSSSSRAQPQKLYSLLHLAARHGLSAVASFVLQQPGGRQALRRTDARGDTVAQEAARRGHKELLELFKLYETSSHVGAEPQQQVYPEGRAFRHHADLGTYTLTLPALHEGEKEAEPGSREHLQEEVEELRRLIHRHRDTQGSSATHTVTHTPLHPVCGLHACTNSLQGSRQDAGPAAATIETRSSTTQEQSRQISLEERREEEEPAGVSLTSCSSGSLCQAQEVQKEVRGSAAAGRNRKNRKKTSKSKKVSPEDGNRTEQRNSKTAGGETKTDRKLPSSPPAEESVTCGEDKNTVETPLPIRPGGKHAHSKAHTTTVTEKQEAEKWEVNLLMCDRAAETEQRHTEAETEAQRGQDCGLTSAARTTGTMGQEQSQDPQESQAEPDGPSPSDTSPEPGLKSSPKSPGAERKPRRVLWRDGGWIGNMMGSAPNGPEEEMKTVWYEAEDPQLRVSESMDLVSQSIWYDCDTQDQREGEQLEPAAGENTDGDLSSPQLLQQAADLTQPHAAGAAPALSHGPTAQRREGHASQKEEEVGPECKEEEGSTRSRKSSETADNEETEGKGRKKRKKKRGKRGGTEAKLSSSSSIESQSQTETQREPGTNLNPEEQTQTGRADTQAAHREEAEGDAMTLPSQTQTRTRDSHGPESNVPSSSPPEISLTEHSRTDRSGETPSPTSEAKDCHRPETFNSNSSDAPGGLPTLQPPGELGLREDDTQGPQTEKRAEIRAPSEEEDQSAVSQESALLECTSPPSTEDLFPEQNTHHTQPVDSDKPGQPVDPVGRPAGFMNSERPAEAGGLPCGHTTDVSPLLTGEGRVETAPRECLEHCLASEMLRDQEQEEEGKNELWVGEEEERKEESDGDKEQAYNQELAAAAVAVVTVAVASAVASIELSQQLAKSAAQSDPSQRLSQLMSSEQSQEVAAETGSWLSEQPHSRPQANPETPQTDPPGFTEDHQAPGAPQAQVFRTLQSDHKPEDQTPAEKESPPPSLVTDTGQQVQLQVESPPPSPVADSGQHTEDLNLSSPVSEDSRDLSSQTGQRDQTMTVNHQGTEEEPGPQQLEVLSKDQLPPPSHSLLDPSPGSDPGPTHDSDPLSDSDPGLPHGSDPLPDFNCGPPHDCDPSPKSDPGLPHGSDPLPDFNCVPPHDSDPSPKSDPGLPHGSDPPADSNLGPLLDSKPSPESDPGPTHDSDPSPRSDSGPPNDSDSSLKSDPCPPNDSDPSPKSDPCLSHGSDLLPECDPGPPHDSDPLPNSDLDPPLFSDPDLHQKDSNAPMEVPNGELQTSQSPADKRLDSVDVDHTTEGRVSVDCGVSEDPGVSVDHEVAVDIDSPAGGVDVGVSAEVVDVGVAVDMVDVGISADTMDVSVSTDKTDIGVTADTVDVGVSADTVDVSVSADKMDVGVSVDTVDAGVSADKMDVGVSVDTVDVGVSADTVDVGVSADTVDVGVSKDTVDGWRQRERTKTGKEEESRGEKDTVEESTEADEDSCEPSRRTQDSTHTLLIQRDRDVFCPVQPRPEPNTVTCTDVLPETEECVSLCLMSTDKDSQSVRPEVDDSVFKKPADPSPRPGHGDRGVHVSWSSTNNAHPSERAPSAGSADSASPRSPRLSWKSETEDRGGGEEEEKSDQLTENPVSSAIMRASIRSLSPLRRHSWEPAGNSAAAPGDITESSPLESPSGDAKRAKLPLHRRSMSWCPSNLPRPEQQHIDSRSYSLEGLEERAALQTPCSSIFSDQQERSTGRREERGSLLSLTEEEQEGDASGIHSQPSHPVLSVTSSCPAMFHHQSLTKSISMLAISHRDPGGGASISSTSGSLEYSISEEEPGPLRSDTEGKGGPKISRTFSYLRNKMTKKGKEKEKEKRGEKERDGKEKERRSVNGHLFVSISPSLSSVCQLCSKPLRDTKDTFICNNCGVYVHKCCRERLPVCSKSKVKMQTLVPEAAPGSAVSMRSKSTSSASSVSSASSSSSRERWSTATTPEDQLPVLFPRRHPSIFNTHSNLSKSISTSNIAGLDDVPLKGLKFLSQSTDSLNQGSKVNASTESLTDEGTEMMDSQLMGEFEFDVKDLEADSWSGTVDKKFLKALKKDEIKRQDVIYELYQTEFHHVRTLKIMTEVYYKGLQKELQLDTLTLDKIFPVLDDLLEVHTRFLSRLLERKRASSSEGQNNNNFLICSVGDILLQQFSGCVADSMKKVYGKFCSRHHEAVNLYKDLHAKDKRFQAFIKRMMSSSIVRRLSIPECILLVTQRITKYPVLIQRILQHTKESDEDHSCVCESLRCVKELIAAVDSKVNEQEKKQRLKEVYSRTDSKSIMRMKSGQMFAKEDLIRGRKLLHDGALQLKNSAGRLKEVQAMLLSDVLVFLQEKDTKFVFASLDQRSTVISLQNLIVREVANEERGLFLITAGIERPEMVEVLASSKEERNTWRAIIQDAMHCMEKDEDEGIPSETEEDRRQQESRAKEIRELLRHKDDQIISLLLEKVDIFRDLSDCSPGPDSRTPPVRERMLFRATADDVTKGEPIIKDALREVETLHTLVHSGVGGAGCSTPVSLTGGSVGPVCLPRRAETFGGFDSHQMNISKNGEKEEGDESLDLRRTESDSVLKKGATASLQMLLKRNNEVQHTVTHLHDLLLSLQAVVVQQDSFIEDQRQALSDRLTASSSRHSSSSSLSSSSSSRPSSLIEQEKHRSLERQRQEAASLQKQQAAHQEEKRRREKSWELKERSLAEREERLKGEEEETSRRRQELVEERETLQRKKEEYQRELERLREAQRRLERDKEALRRDTERLEAMKLEESQQLQRYQRTPSTTSEDSIRFHSSGSLDMDSKEAEEPKEVELSSSAPTKEPFLRIGSKRMGKNFNPFSSSSSSSSKAQGAEKESQLPSRLLQLTKPKEKKEKKKKKGKDSENKVASDPQNDGDIFFC